MSTRHVAKIVELLEWEEDNSPPPIRVPRSEWEWTTPDDERGPNGGPLPADDYMEKHR
jgi:hypothetical protein